MKITAGHSCWAYDDPGAFDDRARDVLRAGLAAGEQVWFVGGRHSGVTSEWLRDVVAARRPGTARIVRLEDAYGDGRVIDPAAQVAAYAAATEQALADGFTGLRVVADVTAVVRTDAQRDAFARYEYAIGRHMRHEPMQAVCAYDRSRLGDRAVAELACLHESTNHTAVTFRLHPGPTSAAAVLDGELDMATEEAFALALERTDLASPDGGITVEARGLRFVDHRSLLILDRFAGARQVTATVRTRLGAAARIAELVGLTHVRVEVVR